MRRSIGILLVGLVAGAGLSTVPPLREAAALWNGGTADTSGGGTSGDGTSGDGASRGGADAGGGAHAARPADGGPDVAAGGHGKGGRGGVATVVTATATRADFPIRRFAVGTLASPAVVEVAARLQSTVTGIDARDGATVKAGDLLFRLDDRMPRATLARDRATLARDVATHDGTVRDVDRATRLAATQAGTRQALDDARTAELAAAATVEADRAAVDADTVQLGYAEIRAPIDGRLGAVAVAVGDLVGGAGTPTALVTVTRTDPLQVGFALPAADLPLVRAALAAGVPDAVAVALADTAGGTFSTAAAPSGAGAVVAHGRLDFVDSAVDTASGTVAVRATIPNADGALWPGRFADVTLDAGTLSGAVAVPTTAVQAGRDGPFVFRVDAGGKVAVAPVTVALVDGDRAALTAGLAPGDVVVTDGQTRLADGATVRVAGAAPPPGSAPPPASPAATTPAAVAGAGAP